jgi:hypothetical protein
MLYPLSYGRSPRDAARQPYRLTGRALNLATRRGRRPEEAGAVAFVVSDTE